MSLFSTSFVVSTLLRSLVVPLSCHVVVVSLTWTSLPSTSRSGGRLRAHGDSRTVVRATPSPLDDDDDDAVVATTRFLELGGGEDDTGGDGGERVTTAYRFKAASSSSDATSTTTPPPLLLVHPVGVGLSSWFWDRLAREWPGEIYAPDLIGCGASDAWDPSERGLFLPLDWTRQCETLVREVVGRPCVAVVQGGLAPVGAQLAARDVRRSDTGRESETTSLVRALVLTSPPLWEDMVKAVPEAELQCNYAFLTSPLLGPIAFGVLETRAVVEFFTNTFLFQGRCDDEWSDNVDAGATLRARPPVAAFNAGLLNARSWEEELVAAGVRRPTLVLSGEADKRAGKREHGYASNMERCATETLPGCNVLPWENAGETSRAILEFCATNGLS